MKNLIVANVITKTPVASTEYSIASTACLPDLLQRKVNYLILFPFLDLGGLCVLLVGDSTIYNG